MELVKVDISNLLCYLLIILLPRMWHFGVSLCSCQKRRVSLTFKK